MSGLRNSIPVRRFTTWKCSLDVPIREVECDVICWEDDLASAVGVEHFPLSRAEELFRLPILMLVSRNNDVSWNVFDRVRLRIILKHVAKHFTGVLFRPEGWQLGSR